jgi:hypothetical protein
MESDLETVTCELTTKTVGLLHRTWMCLKWYPAGQPDQRLDWVGLWDHEPVNTDGWLRSDWVEGYPLVSWAIKKNGETQLPKTLRAAQG